jgi:hypothetical protein
VKICQRQSATFWKQANYSAWHCNQQWHVGSVETITHEHLPFKISCAQWLPNMLTFDQKVHVAVSTKHVHQFQLDRNIFLEWMVTCTRYGCTTLHQSQSGPAWDGIKRDSHYSRHSFQDHGKRVFGFRGHSCWFFFLMMQQLIHSTIATHFKMIFTKQFSRRDLGNSQRSSSYCMTMLVHIGKPDEGDTGNTCLDQRRYT